MRFELFVAVRYLRAKRRDLQDRLLGSTAHVQLMRVASDGIRAWRPLTARLEQLPHVKAASPGLYEQVLVSNGARSGGALIEGIVPAQERRVSDLLSSVTLGSVAALEPKPDGAVPTEDHAPPPIVIGRDLAETIDAGVGSTVQVTSPQGALTPFGMLPRYHYFQV